MWKVPNFRTASVLVFTMILGGTSLLQAGCTEQVPGDNNASNEQGSSSDELGGTGDVAETPQVISADSLFANTKEASSANLVDCSLSPIIGILAFNDAYGEALCRYGWTYVPNYSNQEHIFIIGTNNHVYHTWRNLSTHVGAGWEDQGGFLTSGVIAGTVDGGALRICAVGSDRATVYMKEYLPSRGWGSWVNVGPAWAHCPLQDFPRAFP